ncbi:hypothetical protein N7537_010500 [Penicillium hordei]|uniref:Uncharacterized protein n=1 Tax=Penicillium hordei TaxID=40994 RepID=A0AAD6GVQ2_9EURO|nr:uncharacterized protein N7537_010500 [Penicillium hordei]KAJ5593596.1 hypothetical protein N7537_010500 [Penicillium hordei]
MIDSSDWQERVKWQEPTLAPQVRLPQLEVHHGYRFFVLDHEDVIAAAERRFKKLGVEDPWCVIDIYVTSSEGACQQREELIRSLQESYSNDHFPSDGRIYQKIRSYQGYPNIAIANTAAENYWWAVLESSPGSRKGGRSKKGAYLRSLLNNETLRQSFDDLLPIEGLWDGMNIGVLHKLMAMKCDEPIICYLGKIKQTFYNLAGQDQAILADFDAETIMKIKSLAPKISKGDLEYLNGMENELFPAIADSANRGQILNRLRDIDFPILTLETFFQDILYLDVCQRAMRQLCIKQPERKHKRKKTNQDELERTAPTIDKTLRSQYNNLSEGGIVPASDQEEWLKRDLCDLWRFSFQYAFEMTTIKEHRRRKPRKRVDIERATRLGLHERPNDFDVQVLGHHFLWLAHQRGFKVPADDENQLQYLELPRVMPSDFPPVNEDVSLERRSGNPFTDSVNADRFALSRSSLQSPCNYDRVSAGFVRRSVFNAFFEYIYSGIPDSPAPSPPPAAAESPPDEIDILLADIEFGMEADARHDSSLAGSGSAYVPHATVHNAPQHPPQDVHSFPGPDNWGQQGSNQWGRQAITPVFRIIIDDGTTTEVLLLPNDIEFLRKFFEGLDAHRFHISSSDDMSRGLSWDDCFWYYDRHPDKMLCASYLGKYNQSSTGGKITNEERSNDMNWLESEKLEIRGYTSRNL